NGKDRRIPVEPGGFSHRRAEQSQDVNPCQTQNDIAPFVQGGGGAGSLRSQRRNHKGRQRAKTSQVRQAQSARGSFAEREDTGLDQDQEQQITDATSQPNVAQQGRPILKSQPSHR